MISETQLAAKRALTIEAFCERYSIGRTFAYVEIANGRLKSIAVGRKRLIHVDDAESWFLSFRNPNEAKAA